MSEKDINRWQDTITPRDLAKPWVMGPGGSFDMQDVQPIPDSMLAELAKLYNSHGCPWNCRSLPLSPSDREYMYLLYYSMQGLVARMRLAEKAAAPVGELAMMIRRLCSRTPNGEPRITDATREQALDLLRTHGLLGSPLRAADGGPSECADCNGNGHAPVPGDPEGDHAKCSVCDGHGLLTARGEPFDPHAAEYEACEAADQQRDEQLTKGA